MRKLLLIIRVLIVIFALLQIVSYIAVIQGKFHPKIEQQLSSLNSRDALIAQVSYWVGMNIFLIPIFILLFLSSIVKAKLLKAHPASELNIDSIGNE